MRFGAEVANIRKASSRGYGSSAAAPPAGLVGVLAAKTSDPLAQLRGRVLARESRSDAPGGAYGSGFE